MPLTILTFVTYYLPGFKAGGPLKSIANLVDHLGGEFDFRIITSDRDFGDSAPYSDCIAGDWRAVGKAQVCYLSPAMQGLRPIARLMRETPHDVVYLNGFFDPRFSTLPLVAQRLGLAPRRPTVMAPRGHFSPGALSLKRVKKRVFMAATHVLGLHSGVAWQASTEFEAEDIRRLFSGHKVSISLAQNIHTACNLPNPTGPSLPRSARQPGQPLRVVFLSRISPKKNLLFALEVLAQVNVPVAFSIYGPREDATYWHRCEAVIAGLPGHIRAEYCGPVEPSQVIPILNQHDLFFLPTLGENFGHVIAEALQAGLPVLISDQTPWKDLNALGVGGEYPLTDTRAFVEFIEDTAKMSTGEFAEKSHTILSYAQSLMREGRAVADNRNLFTRIISNASA